MRFALEVTTDLFSDKPVREIILAGQPKHIIENNMKIYKNSYKNSHKFRIIKITNKRSKE
jgi:hypothetical protein